MRIEEGEIYISLFPKEEFEKLGHFQVLEKFEKFPEAFRAPIRCTGVIQTSGDENSNNFFSKMKISYKGNIIYDYMIKDIHTEKYIEEHFPQILI